MHTSAKVTRKITKLTPSNSPLFQIQSPSLITISVLQYLLQPSLSDYSHLPWIHRPSPVIFLLPNCCFIPVPKFSKHSLLTQRTLLQGSRCRYYHSSDPLDPVNQSHSQCYSRPTEMTSIYYFFQFKEKK